MENTPATLLWKILFVDDDEDDYFITRQMLAESSTRKYELVWANSYQAACQVLDANRFDAVLIDYDLGVYSGLELIRLYVARDRREPFILFTARGSYEVDFEAMQAGATLYLTKGETSALMLERGIRYAIERKRTERALAEANGLLLQQKQELDHRLQERSHLLESIQDGFFAIDRDWRITYINQRAAANSGSEPGQIIGNNFWELFPRVLGTLFEKHYRRAMDERVTVHFESPGIYTPGWYNISIYPSIDGISIFWQDISRMKQAEEAARLNLAQFQAIIDNIADGLMVTDGSGNIILCNPAMLRFAGWETTPMENIVQAASQIEVHTSDGEMLSAEQLPLFRALRREVVCDLELTITRLDPRLNQVALYNARPVMGEDGQVALAILTLQDITERKRGQEILAQQDTALREQAELLEQAHVLILDGANRILYWNKGAEQLYGWTKEEAVGQVTHTLFKTEHTVSIQDYEASLLKNGRWEGELVHTTKNGKRLVVASHQVLHTDEQGRPIRILEVNNDISLLKQAEQATQESQRQSAFLASVLEHASQPFAVGYPDGRLGLTNPAFAELTGYTAEELGSIDWVTQLTPPAWLEFEHQKLVELQKTGVPVRYQKEYITKDGRRVPIELLVHQVKDDNGQPLYYYSFITDITERKQAEEKLLKANSLLQQQAEELESQTEELQSQAGELSSINTDLKNSERRLELILDSIADGFYALDQDWRITRINAEALRYFKMKREELLGRTMHQVFRGFTGSKFENQFKKAWDKNKPVHFESKSIATDRIVEMFAYPGPDNLTVLFRDITNRKEREAELRSLNRTLKAHSQSSQAMMRANDETYYMTEVCKIITDVCGHAMVWIGFADNDVAKSIYPVAYAGFEEGYLETLKLTWADTERGRGPTGTAIRTGEISLCRNMLTDPCFEPWRAEALKRNYASSIVFPLRDASHVFGALTIYSRHPDPFSPAEVDLLSEIANDLVYGLQSIRSRQARQQDEEAIQVYAKRLEMSNKELENFAIVASHDLQEPLRKIETFGAQLQASLNDSLTDVQRDFMARMQNSSRRMRSMIEGLLALSRVTTHGNPFIPVDLNSVARLALEDVEERLLQTGGQVLLGELPTLRADPIQIQELLQNLIGNALKFHKPGVAPLVKVASRPLLDGRVEISVEDNGVGFDMAHATHLFQPFQRLHGRSEFEGTGIGLSICRKIAERHGGTLTAKSQPGVGSTFTIILPVRSD